MMKVNYFSYSIDDASTGHSAFENISSIVDHYCEYQNKNLLAKDHKIKKLYLAKPLMHANVFYLMTPAPLGGFKAVDRLQGVIKDLVSVLGADSLEKVAYIYLDPKFPIIGFASGRGCADIDDLCFFINEIINDKKSKKRYAIDLKPIRNKVMKGDASNFKLITSARVRLESNKAKGILGGFLGKSPSDNMVVEVIVKRTDRKENIKDFISPLLDSLADKNDKSYAEVYLKAKADEFQSNVKEYMLDSSGVMFDFLNPNLKTTMEEQIVEKRYKNQEVVEATNGIVSSFSDRVKASFNDSDWDKMKEADFHKS